MKGKELNSDDDAKYGAIAAGVAFLAILVMVFVLAWMLGMWA